MDTLRIAYKKRANRLSFFRLIIYLSAARYGQSHWTGLFDGIRCYPFTDLISSLEYHTLYEEFWKVECSLKAEYIVPFESFADVSFRLQWLPMISTPLIAENNYPSAPTGLMSATLPPTTALGAYS